MCPNMKRDVASVGLKTKAATLAAMLLLPPHVFAADVELGRYLATECTTCHGASKTDSTIPTEARRNATTAGAVSTCCGGPAPEGRDGCCAQDAEVKASGGQGCGCNSAQPAPAAPARGQSGCCS